MNDLLKKLASELALASDSLPAHLKSKSTSLLELVKFQATRLGHDQPYLVVGLLGPNNAGKSTFFTKFTECGISPPHTDGGFTKHLAAAAHPETLKRLCKENNLGEFKVVEASAPPGDAQRQTVPLNTLFLAPSPRTPRHLVIIDSPDFDSVGNPNHKGSNSAENPNHKLSAGLSRIADLIVCVVTKHTYRNEKVHEVMSLAIDHGRPYVVVYNEALEDTRIAARHLELLIDGFASKPQGRFYALLDTDVQSDPKALKVLSIDDGRPFELAFLSADGVKRLLLQANASKLAKLADDVEGMTNDWAKHAGLLKRFMDGITTEAGSFGRSVAAAGYPIEPLRDAVIEILNERGFGHKVVRIPAQWLAENVSWASKQVWRGASAASREVLELVGRHTEESPAEDTSPEAGLIGRERKKFDAEWTGFVKDVEKLLNHFLPEPAERAAFKHERAAIEEKREEQALGEERKAFEEEFHPDRLSGIKKRILEDAAEDLIPKDYLDFCRREVRKALDKRGNNEDLQWLASAIAIIPAAAGVGAGFATGGLGGEDAAIAGAAVITTPLFDMLVRTVGKGTAQRIRDEWVERRGKRIEEAVERSLAPKICRAWENQISKQRECDSQFKMCAKELKELV